jgi:hypothetical protein
MVVSICLCKHQLTQSYTFDYINHNVEKGHWITTINNDFGSALIQSWDLGNAMLHYLQDHKCLVIQLRPNISLNNEES